MIRCGMIKFIEEYILIVQFMLSLKSSKNMIYTMLISYTLNLINNIYK